MAGRKSQAERSAAFDNAEVALSADETDMASKGSAAPGDREKAESLKMAVAFLSPLEALRTTDRAKPREDSALRTDWVAPGCRKALPEVP